MPAEKFDTFTLTFEDGEPALHRAELLLDPSDPMADLESQTDWDGDHQPGGAAERVACVGLRRPDGSWATSSGS